MIIATLLAVATMCSSDAIAILLNSPASSSRNRYALALETVRKEAEAGKPLQQFVLGLTTDDKELAKRYIEASGAQITALAEQTNNSLAWYLLSVEKNDINLLRKAAAGGNVQALNALGTLVAQKAVVNAKTLSESEIKKLHEESYEYFKQAALKRDPNAFINLGTCYLRGLGCRVDMSIAVECFRSAARMGHPEGMDNLSACYEFGHGVNKNPTLSLYWRMKARSLRGDESATKWLEEGK
jgi:TPR repeat protein